MSEKPASIIPSREVQSLSRECGILRDEVARLLAEAYDLVHVVKPNLFAFYQTKLGAWELKRLRLQCDVGRLKRKISLIQERINRAETVHRLELEGQLDLEFLDWQTRVAEAVAELDSAKSRLANPIGEEEAQELRNTYRALVKRLHPDLHEDLTDQERQLWHRVQEAYDHSDLNELRALALIQPGSTRADAPNTIEQLVAERDALKSHVVRLLAQLAAIESQAPFTMRKQLADNEWIEQMRGSIDEECVLLEAQRAELETHATGMMASAHDGNRFSRN